MTKQCTETAGADMEARDFFGATAIHLAVEFQRLEAIKMLTAYCADIEAPHSNDNGWRPLHRAAHWGDSATIKVLLGCGAVVDSRDTSGRTPLHVAARRGKVAAVRTLLEAGASCDAFDSKGDTPFEKICTSCDDSVKTQLKKELSCA